MVEIISPCPWNGWHQVSQEGDHFLVTYKGSKRDLLLGYTNLYEFTKHTYVIICIYIYLSCPVLIPVSFFPGFTFGSIWGPEKTMAQPHRIGCQGGQRWCVESRSWGPWDTSRDSSRWVFPGGTPIASHSWIRLVWNTYGHEKKNLHGRVFPGQKKWNIRLIKIRMNSGYPP